MHTPTCPCCSHTLLRHARSGEVYWFCRYCYEEMPNLLTTDPSWIRSTTFLATTAGLPKKGLASPSYPSYADCYFLPSIEASNEPESCCR